MYQIIISPMLGPRCRFYPTCSEYSRQAFDRFSIFKALWYSTRRLMKCHPFNRGGADFLPEN